MISAIAAVAGVLTGTLVGWERTGPVPAARPVAGVTVGPVRPPSSAAAPTGAPAPAATIPRASPPLAAAGTTPDPAPSSGVVPTAFVGAWQEDSLRDGQGGGAIHRIVIRAGRVGERVAAFMDVTTDDMCRSQATLRSAGAALVLDEEVVEANPPSACAAARRSTLRLHGDELRWNAGEVTVALHRTTDPAAAVPRAYLGSWLALEKDDPTAAVRMTIRQGPVGGAVATFAWDSAARHCEGTSLLVSSDAHEIRLSPERVTDSAPQGACTASLTRILFAPDGDGMRAEWAGPEQSTLPRSFEFARTP